MSTSSSLRMTPATDGGAPVSLKDTANSQGLHDTMRYGVRNLAVEASARQGLETRLSAWEETQDNLKLTLQRSIYGIHAPVRQLMERKLVAENPHMPGMAVTNIHLDILMGRDEMLDTTDIFAGSVNGPRDVHLEMERQRRIL